MENRADIELRYLLYQSESVVQLIFAYNSDLIRHLKAHTTARWSSSLQCWYILCNEFNPERFKRHFGHDYYLHATIQHATAILNNVRDRLTASDTVRPSGLFARPDPEKEEKMRVFRTWMVCKRYMLREYYKIYKPKIWLSEGQWPGQKLSETSNFYS